MILVDLIDGTIHNHFIQNIMNLFQVEHDLGRVGKEGEGDKYVQFGLEGRNEKQAEKNIPSL